MKKNIKSVLITVAVVGMVAIGLGLNAANILDNGKNGVKSNTVAPINGWYTISITNPSDPDNEANQAIISLGSTPPLIDEFGCAQQDNDGNVCMVNLTFQPTATTVPATIAAARLASSLTNVGSKAQSPAH